MALVKTSPSFGVNFGTVDAHHHHNTFRAVSAAMTLALYSAGGFEVVAVSKLVFGVFFDVSEDVPGVVMAQMKNVLRPLNGRWVSSKAREAWKSPGYWPVPVLYGVSVSRHGV